MKRLLLAAAFIAILLSGATLMGCTLVPLDEAAGLIMTEEYDFTDFTGIEIGHAFELEVTPSDNYSIAITAREKTLDNITVSRDGDLLKIDLDSWFLIWHTTPVVKITMPVLSRLDMSGASHGDARGFRSANALDLELSGASNLDIDMGTGPFQAHISGASRLTGFLEASGSSFELSGASEVVLTGTGGNLLYDASGASSGELIDLPVLDANIELSGASDAVVDVSGRLDADLSGASSLEYYGTPTLGTMEISGASDIEHKTNP
jgi:hypothetical protein